MSIEKEGAGAGSAGFRELAGYIRKSSAAGDPARIILQCACGCRASLFRVHADPFEGAAMRACAACGRETLIGDSNQVWEFADPVPAACACGSDLFEVAVGFAFRADNEVQRITVGQRCARCGSLGTAADWKLDDSQTEELLERT